MADEPTKQPHPNAPPTAAGDRPTSGAPAEPHRADVSRTDVPGAGVSSAPPVKPAAPSEHPLKTAAPSGPSEPPPPADMTPPAFVASLEAAIPGGVSAISYWVGGWTLIVPVAELLAVARHLRDASDASFDFCSDVTATDWPLRTERFDVHYCLYSTRHRHRVRVKVKAAEYQPVPSVAGIWRSANWLEREAYDMFGVNFADHPDRRRILMPEDWQGYPQRKDYPLEGPGELLMENPLDWLKLKQSREEADIE